VDFVVCKLGDLLAADLCGTTAVDPKVTKVIGAKVAAARALLAKAGTQTKAEKSKTFVRRADAQLAALQRAVKKALQKKRLSRDCRTTINGLITVSRTRVRDLL
jgi:hypothetical protein